MQFENGQIAIQHTDVFLSIVGDVTVNGIHFAFMSPPPSQ